MSFRLLLLGTAVLLSGCSLVDEFMPPASPKPAAWQTRVAEQPPEWPSAGWWRRFGSPRLDALMAQAEKANYDIAAAAARVRQADAQLQQAGSALLPSITASGDAQRERNAAAVASATSGTTLTSRSRKVTYNNSFSLSSTASYELDFWGKNRAATQAAEFALAASRFDARTVQLTTQSSVATSYFDILGLAERLIVSRETVTNSESVLEAIRDRMAAGTATVLDIAQQESVVASQRATIAPLEQQYRQTVNALAILVAEIPETLVVEPEPLAAIALPVVQPGLPSELLTRRPDVQAAEAQLAAANQDIAVARATWFPSISLTADGGFTSTALNTLLRHTSLAAALAAGVSQTVYDGGKTSAQIAERRARYDELAQTYGKTVLTAFTDVESALVAVQKTRETVEAQRASEATARNAYDISMDQMRAGLVDITTVLNTQRTLFVARDALVQARLNHLQAVVGLYKAMGGGWE